MNSGPCAWVKEFTTWITPQCFWFFIVFFFQIGSHVFSLNSLRPWSFYLDFTSSLDYTTWALNILCQHLYILTSHYELFSLNPTHSLCCVLILIWSINIYFSPAFFIAH
jgi:hypothetical protein